MYENYLTYHHIPCGAVLDRIRTKKHLTQRELASRSEIPYQRINDFIANRRRISPENSLKLEKALGVDYQCFFYQIQTNYEIFVATSHLSEQSQPDKSKYRKTLFWDTTSIPLTGNAIRNGLFRGFLNTETKVKLRRPYGFMAKTKLLTCS